MLEPKGVWVWWSSVGFLSLILDVLWLHVCLCMVVPTETRQKASNPLEMDGCEPVWVLGSL